MLRTLVTLLLVLSAAAAASCGEASSEPARPPERHNVIVYGPTSLEHTLEPLLRAFGDEHAAVDVIPTYGGTTVQRLQIEGGATVDLFVASDEKSVAEMQAKTRMTAAWLTNHLVVIAPPGSTASIETLFRGEGLVALFGASPEIAEFTRLGLQRKDLWNTDLELRIVRLADAHGIINQVATGAAACGVIYETDARRAGGKVRIVGPLPLPDGVEITYTLAAFSERGEELARWLLDSPTSDRAAEQEGFSPADDPAGE